MRVLQALANRGHSAQHVLDVRTIQDRRIFSAVPAPPGPSVSRLRAADYEDGARSTLINASGCPLLAPNIVGELGFANDSSAIMDESLSA